MEKEPSEINEQELEGVSGGTLEEMIPELIDKLHHDIEDSLKVKRDLFDRTTKVLDHARQK